MIKKLLCLLLCMSLLFCLCSCTGTENTESPSSTELPLQESSTTTATTQENVITQAVQITPPTEENSEIIITETLSETVSVMVPATVPTPVEPETQENTTSSAPQTTKTVEKTGEMAFSDDSSNRYIEAVSSKYGVDANNLVALYTVPENDSNIVLEFDGTKKDDGTLSRNKDTLIAIYSIDKSLNSKRASENSSLNEYSYGEMKVMFISVTTYIMPEFEELK